LLAALCFPLLAAGQQPFGDRAFSARPNDLIAAARTIAGPTDAEVVVLFDETQIVYDTAGRAVETMHMLYRIGTAPAQDWSVVAALWQPWRQQRPTIRARVITADAREIQLDEKALAETPVPAPEPDIFPDGRILRGPLPATSPGAIVEVQIIIRDTQPLFDRGLVRYLPLGKLVPVLRTAITVEAPSTVSLRHVVRLLPNAVVSRTTSGKTTTLKIENGRLDALDPEELVLSSAENPKHPFVAFSTGASWNDVATGYGSIVDSRIAASNTSSLIKEIVGDATVHAVQIRIVGAAQESSHRPGLPPRRSRVGTVLRDPGRGRGRRGLPARIIVERDGRQQARDGRRCSNGPGHRIGFEVGREHVKEMLGE
jgi:hypothetical protein